MKVECVLNSSAIVGESPLWSSREKKLYWVDIQNKNVHRFDPGNGHNESFKLPDIVTCLGFRKSGGLILTLAKDIAFFNPDTGAFEKIMSVEKDQPQNRFNDGRCDPQGRFWAGTMDAKDWQSPSGSLYCLDSSHKLSPRVSDVICSNGTAWSPDGKTMYHTESFRYAIFAYDFDGATGEISHRRKFAQLDPHKKIFPDGLTVDAEGGVWSNHVGNGQIQRYEPNGKPGPIIQLPVPRATGCTFGGTSNEILYVTSARETMSAAELKEFPLSGSLFAVSVGVKGLPATAYEG